MAETSPLIILSADTALEFVKKSIDEFTSIAEGSMMTSSDSPALEKMVDEAMEEAVVRVHENADPRYLDGVTETVTGTAYTPVGGTAQSTILQVSLTTDVIRVLSIQNDSSPILVTEFIPEGSAEARKQENEHIRGTYDDPRVVQRRKSGAGGYKPEFIYYSISDPGNKNFTVEYIPYPDAADDEYSICPRLKSAVLNEVTAIVLEGLGEVERAQIHRARYAQYMQKQ